MERESHKMIKQKPKKIDKDVQGRIPLDDAFSEESDNVDEERRLQNIVRKTRRKTERESTKTASDPSSD